MNITYFLLEGFFLQSFYILHLRLNYIFKYYTCMEYLIPNTANVCYHLQKKSILTPRLDNKNPPWTAFFLCFFSSPNPFSPFSWTHRPRPTPFVTKFALGTLSVKRHGLIYQHLKVDHHAESSGLNLIGTMNAQLLPEPSTSKKNHKKIMETRRIGKLFLSSRSSTMKENQLMYV